MNKTIIPLVMTAAMLASCDHYDHTDGRAMVTGGSFYPAFNPQPRQIARPVAKPVAPKPAPKPVAAPAPRPAASPASQHQPRVAMTPPPAPQPVAIPAPAPQPVAKPAPIPAPAAQEEQPAKPTYAVMPGQNRGLRVRPRR